MIALLTESGEALLTEDGRVLMLEFFAEGDFRAWWIFGTVVETRLMQRNATGQTVTGQLVSVATGGAFTAGTVTVYVTLDGGTQAEGQGTVEHEGNGAWTYRPTREETDAAHVAYTFSAPGAVTQTVNVWTQALVIAVPQGVRREVLDIVAGDDWSEAPRLIDYTVQPGEAWPDTIATVHITLTPNAATLRRDADAASLVDVAGVVVQATGSAKRVQLPLAKTQTATLAATPEGNGYEFQVVANKDTKPAVIRAGTMTVRRRLG